MPVQKIFRFRDTTYCPRKHGEVVGAAHATDNARVIEILTYCRARA